MLKLLENKITQLGCDFINRVLNPQSSSAITILMLDHNDISSLGRNKNLEELSLAYCKIDYEGVRAIFDILINTKSRLKYLNLICNQLRNEGIIFLREFVAAKVLEEFSIADSQFGEDVLAVFKLSIAKTLILVTMISNLI